MSEPGTDRVDVVIPVYNARELAQHCIEALYRHLEARIGDVYVEDDASSPETAAMLDSLAQPRLRVHHGATNQGFGESVNCGVARTRTEWALVLNSDVTATNDFVTPLVRAMREEPRLAAVSPAGNTMENYPLDRYARRGPCINTYSLWGYAFLVRREAFDEVGGFDSAFGRGYFEDLDISRKWLAREWWLGVHPETQLHHDGHGSFDEVADTGNLMRKNRELYWSRYPEARRRILVWSAAQSLEELPESWSAELDHALRSGSIVTWLGGRDPTLPGLPVRGRSGGWFRALRLFRRPPGSRISELWLDGRESRVRALSLRTAAARMGVTVREAV